MVRQWQEFFYERRYAATPLRSRTDFVKIAEAHGLEGFLVDTRGQALDVVERARSAEGTVSIHFRC